MLPSFKSSLFKDVDMFGQEIECIQKIKSFITEVNIGCGVKRNNFLEESINRCMKEKDYDKLLTLLKHDQLNDFSQFRGILITISQV